MNYKLIYDRLVKRGQERATIEGYKERHHIIPKCMGGDDNADNLVDLTPEEHFVAHQLLVKIYPNNLKLVRACDVMSKDTKTNKYWKKNKMYGWLRRKLYVPRIITTCKYCNCSFESRECSKRKFCSHSCKKLSQQNIITLNCLFCSKEFNVIPSKAKTRQFCSPKCSSLSQKRNDNKQCECCTNIICGSPHIIKNRRFCSKECVDNSRRGVSTPPTRFAEIISKPCALCNNLIYGKPGILKQKKYCSVRCRAISQRVIK